MKKLNQTGIAPWILPLFIIGVIAAIGVYVMKGSHADAPAAGSAAVTPGTYSDRFLTVSPTIGSLSFTHGNHNTSVIPAGPTFNPINLYQIGFTITDKKALQYRLDTFSSDAQGGFLNGGGNLTAGQATNVIAYINPDVPNGTYHFNAQLSYLIPTPNQKQTTHWRQGPRLSYTVSLTGTPYLDYFSLQPPGTNGVNVSLHRSQANPTTGLIMGPALMLVSTSGASYQLKNVPPAESQGFYPPSGRLFPQQPSQLQSYISPRIKPNGIYQGSTVIQYLNTRQQWMDGPTVYYTINLTD